MTPTVSVIIPAYNAEAYIGEALASASAQTLREIEVIVVDDVSTDGTAATVEAAIANDPRIRLLRQPANAGPSAARNQAIDAARGTWIALLDADDSYLPDRLERLVILAEARRADLCADNLLLVREGSVGAAPAMIPPNVLATERPLTLSEFIERNVADKRYPALNLGFLKPIISRQFLVANNIRYNEAVRFAEDFALYADCFHAGASWWLTPYAGYRYRLRSGSLTHIQTVADLAALRRKQQQLRDAARGDAGLTKLIARHARSVDRNYYYRAFTDAIKAKRYAAAQQELFASSNSARLIAEEVIRQLPTLIKKNVSRLTPSK